MRDLTERELVGLEQADNKIPVADTFLIQMPAERYRQLMRMACRCLAADRILAIILECDSGAVDDELWDIYEALLPEVQDAD